MSLHAIEDKPAGELPVLSAGELEEIKDANVIVNKIVALETRIAQMKPNLGAIAEYKKKVGTEMASVIVMLFFFFFLEAPSV